MNPLFQAAREIFAALNEMEVRGCLIGGLALQRWGQPRLTVDIDLTLAVETESETRIVDALLSKFKARITDAKEFALTRRVLLLEASNGVGIDLALGLTSFEAKTVERSTPYEFAPGFVFPTCSAEDLLVHKCFAGRAQDLIDAEHILIRNQGKLDLAYIRYWLKELGQAAEEPDISRRFEQLYRKVTEQ